MPCYNIMTILVNHRTKNAAELQDVLTKSGCIIKVRLGLHEAGDICSEEGLIILQLVGSKEDIKRLNDDLNMIDGIKSKTVELCSD